MGPWSHTELLTKGLAISVRETLDWLGTHLGGAPALQRPSAVNVFVNGQGWRNLPDWPPATTERALYLHPGGRLGEIAPEAGAAPATFRYDPADPTPTTGGPLLSPNGGYPTTAGCTARDVLDFTGATLTQRSVRVREPGHRAGAHLGQSPRRPVRPGQRGRRQRPIPQCQRRLPAPGRRAGQ